MSHPYDTLPEKAFWSPAVAKRHPFDIETMWSPKWPISRRAPIVTFGSCFAQHIGRAMAGRGYAWTSMEPAPTGLSPENARRFNYDVFSARTGNIYRVSLLRQWVSWALGDTSPPDIGWETPQGRVLDPFRPMIEPDGFASHEEMLAARATTIAAFGKAIREAQLFVFTLGLTEGWLDTDGYEYAMCPGTVGGTYDADRHIFENARYPDIRRDLREAIAMMRAVNPKLRILLTVSPVPLTATASGQHVLTATVHSKSILRAVAGDIAGTYRYVDYFPSYEIVTAPPFRGMAFEPNMRSVNPKGVAQVMDRFFADLATAFPKTALSKTDQPKTGRSVAKPAGSAASASAAAENAAGAGGDAEDDDLVCEEALLEAFSTDRPRP